jgi:hypothetical protein
VIVSKGDKELKIGRIDNDPFFLTHWNQWGEYWNSEVRSPGLVIGAQLSIPW